MPDISSFSGMSRIVFGVMISVDRLGEPVNNKKYVIHKIRYTQASRGQNGHNLI